MAREALARKRSNGVTTAPVADEPVDSDILAGPGWESHEVARESRKGYPRYSVQDGTTENVIKFTQDGYFTAYLRHWTSKFPVTCLKDDCPMCARGDKARPVYFFNVIDMTNEGDDDHDEPTLKVWEASSDPFKAIKARAEDSKYQPISRSDLYFVVHKEKEKNSNVRKFFVDPVKERDLKDDFGVEPLTEDELAELTADLYDKSIVRVATRADLDEAAKELKDE